MVRPTPLIVLVLLLSSSTEAVGQIWERFTFQDSFSGKFSGKVRRVKPASFSVLLPDDTTASYSIRSAMRVNFGFETLGQRIAIGPFVEYRLLTNIKKPQNVFMVGLSTDWQTRDAEAEGEKWSAVLAARVIYKTDYERSTRSVLTDLRFTPVAEERGGGLSNLFLPNVATEFGSAVEFTYSPSIGLEHESVVSAADESLENSIVRAVTGVRAELIPLPSHLARRLELTLEYSYVYDDYTSTILFPTITSRPRHDTATYGACPGPVSRQFRPHGLNLRPGENGRHTLYVVGHGDREAIEVFELDLGGAVPTLNWVGCVVAPEALALNSVVALPEGGFAATSPRTGDVWEWSTDAEWSRVPGSEGIGPNGLEISRDGRWFYVGGYGSQSLIRLSRGRTPVQTDAVEVGFHIDNVRWGPDETLFAAGHVGPTRAAIGECIGQRHSATG